MTRTRWGLVALSSLTLKFPLASVWVRPDSSIPWARLSSTTSSPAAGLLVVPFLTAPVRVWAETDTTRTAHSNTRESPPFWQSTREMGHPVSCSRVLRRVVGGDNFKLWLLFGLGVTTSLQL